MHSHPEPDVHLLSGDVDDVGRQTDVGLALQGNEGTHVRRIKTCHQGLMTARL
ncbi:hypothetical protein MAHJHV65_34840 [Mycobacterium avium subsp. hominissuis]